MSKPEKPSQGNPFEAVFEPHAGLDSDGDFAAALRRRAARPIENNSIVDLHAAHRKHYESVFADHEPVRQELIEKLRRRVLHDPS
jgi:hypothetical protein